MQGCGIPVCVSKGEGDHGCIDASPNLVTGDSKVIEATFLCPQCHHAARKPIEVSDTDKNHIIMANKARSVSSSRILCQTGFSVSQLFPVARNLLDMGWFQHPVCIKCCEDITSGAFQFRSHKGMIST
jgi:hypothetical protein